VSASLTCREDPRDRIPQVSKPSIIVNTDLFNLTDRNDSTELIPDSLIGTSTGKKLIV
jgi:nitrogenase molybdenum-iron protein alpha/beta subunit